MSKTYSKTRTLVECALMIALGTVLANIKIFEMPNGGSITLLSMLPFILVSYRHGTKWGLFTGFVNSLLQMLLGFWAPWCGYCRRIGPAYEKIADEYGDRLTVAKVNIDEEAALAEAAQIEVIPTLVLYRDGKAVDSIVNPGSKAAIDQFIQEAMAK